MNYLLFFTLSLLNQLKLSTLYLTIYFKAKSNLDKYNIYYSMLDVMATTNQNNQYYTK